MEEMEVFPFCARTARLNGRANAKIRYSPNIRCEIRWPCETRVCLMTRLRSRDEQQFRSRAPKLSLFRLIIKPSNMAALQHLCNSFPFRDRKNSIHGWKANLLHLTRRPMNLSSAGVSSIAQPEVRALIIG